MRRKDRAITDFAAMLAIVRDCDCCRLGIAAAGAPYILPLNFGCETEGETLTLYFHGATQGEKYTLLRENPQVSFEMDTGCRLLPGPRAEAYSFAYRCVMGRGTVEILQGEDAKRHGLNCIMAHYTGCAAWEISAHALRATTVLRLRVTAWSAKAHTAP